MVYMQIAALGLLLLSDFMLLYGFMMYTVTHGDPKALEHAKNQTIFGFTGSIISTCSLVGMHFIKGVHSYTSVEWFSIYAVLISVMVFVCSVLFYHVFHYVDAKRTNKFFWMNAIPILEVLMAASVLFFVLFSQVFVVLITVKSFF